MEKMCIYIYYVYIPKKHIHVTTYLKNSNNYYYIFIVLDRPQSQELIPISSKYPSVMICIDFPLSCRFMAGLSVLDRRQWMVLAGSTKRRLETVYLLVSLSNQTWLSENPL